jgi:hypothetical protein
MIDPYAVLLQVEQGNTPTTWHILKGKDFRFEGILVGAFILLFLSLFIGTVVENFLHLHLLFNDFPHLSPSFPYIALGIVLIAVLKGYKSWRRGARERDSILVLMPDGLIQCTNYHAPTEHEYKILSYPEITKMTFRRIDASTSTIERTRFMHIDYAIDIVYKNSQSEQWIVDRRFGYPDDVARMIIREFEKYCPEQAL